MNPNLRTIVDDIALLRTALLIANAAVVTDVHSECTCHAIGGLTWWDTTPMTNLHEHSPAVVDMNRQALDWGLATGLLIAHPQQAHLVRVPHQPD